MYFDASTQFQVTKCPIRTSIKVNRNTLTVLLALSIAFVATHEASAETYLLKQGEQSHSRTVKAVLEVEGNVRLNPDGKKVREFPMTMKGNLQYDERLLGPEHPIAAIRHYTTASADMTMSGKPNKSSLAHSKSLIALEHKGAKASFFTPQNHLQREEIDLINIPGNSLLIDFLLPKQKVAINDTWTFKNEELVGLLCLDAISANDVKAKLTAVKDNVAQMELSGTVAGAIDGIATDIKLKGRVNFDFKTECINWVAIAIEEDRSIGHTAPGFRVTAVLRVLIVPRDIPETLTDEKLAKLDLTPDEGKLLIELESQTGFRLMHEPNWHVLSENEKTTVFRMVKRGELVSQCNITRLNNLNAGEHMTIEAFQRDVQKALGDNFGQIIDASQRVNSQQLRELRLTVTGASNQLPITWVYYLFSNDLGHRYSVVFTLESNLTDKFAEADRSLVSSFELLARPEPKAAPTAAATEEEEPAIQSASNETDEVK
ncbi:MAG: hypothetical protein COA78_27605 [Blastopirellula sp.]|nr:MAG: hypothetical protein COA78_27605 [Blastopirellula sp.]